MSKHWEKASKRQIAWADAHGFLAVKPERPDSCLGCALLANLCEIEPCRKYGYEWGIIFKRKEDLSKDFEAIAKSFSDDLFGKTQETLEGYWHFEFDPEKTLESNIYEFNDRLTLYGNFCRRWEEHHNGSCCVVGRVRDKYLWPKIKQFAADIRAGADLIESFRKDLANGRPCQKNKLATSGSGNKRPLTEGMVKRGGVNERPTSPKQEIKPPPQRPA